MDIQRLVIANPSGNITAIVFDPTPPERRREIGSTIRSEYLNVEQVLFAELRNGVWHAEMEGKEFCGNAARAFGYVLTQGKDGQVIFTMSGTSSPVTVDVSSGHAALTVQMPLRIEQVLFEDRHVPVVHLDGISHAIMRPEHPLYNFLKRTAARLDRWESVTHVLEDLGIKDKPASGLIFAEHGAAGLSITPYVYVKAPNTLYPEMACASGSIATAFAMGNGDLLNRGMLIRQPSREDLTVSIKLVGSATEIKVAGSMSINFDGPAKELHYSQASLIGRQGNGAVGQRFALPAANAS